MNKTAVFIEKSYGPMRDNSGRMTTCVNITQDLDRDGTYQIIFNGKQLDLHGIHLVRKLKEVTEDGHKLWELVDE
jgi:hypothetical protein